MASSNTATSMKSAPSSFAECALRVTHCKNKGCTSSCGFYDGSTRELTDICVICGTCTAAQHLDPLADEEIVGIIAQCQNCWNKDDGSGCGVFIPKALTGDDSRECRICNCARGQHIMVSK